MANDQELLNYIKTRHKVSVPELQKKFSASYSDIAKLIRKLISEGAIRLDSIQYSVLQKGEAENGGGTDENNAAKTPLCDLPEEAAPAADIIRQTLAGFRINAEVADVTVGAAVMRFELNVPCNAASSVIRRDAELAMRLRQRDGVRVYAAPSGEKVFIEVPRAISEREKVQAGELIHDENERWKRPGSCCFAIGKKVGGESVYGDLSRLKHILIGGTCCSGKSTLLHTMIYSLMAQYTPDEVRLILCDAKRTEFAHYSGMPHLLTGQIVTEAKELVRALHWTVGEMERRYQIFINKRAAGEAVRDIDEYNAARKEGEERLARIVIVIDEYAEFLMAAKHDIGDGIQRLAQKARAAGIYLVLATQKPSADVIPGALKCNFSTRIAFRMVQEVDSRAVLDEDGAEKLLGFGDMLMKKEGDSQCERIQGGYLPHEILVAAVAAIGRKYEAKFDEKAKEYFNRADIEAASAESKGLPDGSGSSADSADQGDSEDSDDPCRIQALALVIKEGKASISLIQRKCGVGYNHAGKIIEWMEGMGYVSPFDSRTSKRTVFLTKEEFVKKYGPLD